MNLFPARLDATGEQAIMRESVYLPLNPTVNSEKRDTPVTLGMRPEHLETCETRNALMNLQVEMLEKLGEDTVVYGKLYQTDISLTVRLPGIHPVDSGDKMALTIPPEYLHVFDSDSGRRLN
mgnify:CR=1 FL=1